MLIFYNRNKIYSIENNRDSQNDVPVSETPEKWKQEKTQSKKMQYPKPDILLGKEKIRNETHNSRKNS